jgi:hypothetical protein
VTAGTPISRSTVPERDLRSRFGGTVRSDRCALRWSKPQTLETRSSKIAFAVSSPLLVIVHYLLKNNTTFMALVLQGRVSLPLHIDVTSTGGDA